MLPSLRKFNHSEVAQERLKIIQFYDEQGEAKTKKYFGVNRKTVWAWKHKLVTARGQLAALILKSTRPRQVRRMATDPRIVAFIRNLREEHPHLGKEKIKPLLDAYCRSVAIGSLAVSTIGKVMHRNHFTFPKKGRVYHDPNSHFAQQTGRRPKKRLRVRYAPKPQELGHVQMDTIERLLDGLTVYFYSAIDIKGKFGFSLPYRQCNSVNGADFLRKFQQVYPLTIHDVQTDNGSEFLDQFEVALEKQGIPHLFSYPRCPKINGCVERYQRTLSEEFIEVHEALIRNGKAFHLQLAQYLVFYNCQRVHEALQMKTPLDFLISEKAMSKMSVTCTTI